MDFKEKILDLTRTYYPDIVKVYHQLHSNPELSGKEFSTSKTICKILDNLNIPYKKGFAKHGIVAHISNNNSKKVIALRADMDALPISESTKLPFKSLNPGIMHACGHDIHMSCLLGTAMVLNDLKEELEGIVKLIFQPSEEKIPGGAKKMIDEGVFDDIKPDIILAQHVMPELNTGTIGLRSGMMMASSDKIEITVKGKGGHAALPAQSVDPVVISAHLILSLQQIISRKSLPIIPSVLSFGKVEANGSHNIIPDEVKILGTFRTYNEVWRNQAHKTIESMSKTLTESMGGKCEVIIHKGYPALINDDKTTQLVKKLSRDFLGISNVLELDPDMGSEDFAYFAEQVPAVLYRLGVSKNKDSFIPLHNSQFYADTDSFIPGTSLMAYLAFSLLKN